MFGEAPLQIGLRAQFCGDINLPQGTQRDIGCLATCPTAREGRVVCVNRRNLGLIENYSAELPVDHTFMGFRKKAIREDALAFFRYFAYCPRTPPIKGSPIVCEQLCPFLGDSINTLFSPKRVTYRTNSDSSYVGIAPFTDRIVGRVPEAHGSSSSGEQRLMVKCGELALRIVWWPVTVAVYGSAVSSHDKFIFREIDNNDRAGINLGVCRVRSQHDGPEYERELSHVILSTGSASIFAGTICYGCTILTSQDTKTWYEIIAVQEGLGSPKRDPLAPLPCGSKAKGLMYTAEVVSHRRTTLGLPQRIPHGDGRSPEPGERRSQSALPYMTLAVTNSDLSERAGHREIAASILCCRPREESFGEDRFLCGLRKQTWTWIWRTWKGTSRWRVHPMNYLQAGLRDGFMKPASIERRDAAVRNGRSPS